MIDAFKQAIAASLICIEIMGHPGEDRWRRWSIRPKRGYRRHQWQQPDADSRPSTGKASAMQAPICTPVAI